MIRFADNTNPESLASKLRRRRMAEFFALLRNLKRPVCHVLDVGGTENFWVNAWPDTLGVPLSITLLNLSQQEISSGLPIRSIAGDARDLSRFENGQFDYCFSNSVIEHVGTLADQLSMASEIRRVAKGYFVQTPNRYFPVEAHFQFPGWAQLPLISRTFLHQKLDLGWMKAQPNYLKARIDVEGVRLLCRREFGLLFPDADIRYEKIGPLVKSMMAVRPA